MPQFLKECRREVNFFKITEDQEHPENIGKFTGKKLFRMAFPRGLKNLADFFAEPQECVSFFERIKFPPF